MGGDSGLGPERIGEAESVGGGDPREGADDPQEHAVDVVGRVWDAAATGGGWAGDPAEGGAWGGDPADGLAWAGGPAGGEAWHGPGVVAGGTGHGGPVGGLGSGPDGGPDGGWDDLPAPGDPDELPRLMARLGRLIARHGPGGVVAMARSDAERRELLAYAAGWQDAAAEFTPRVAAARRDGWLGRWRPLRVLNGPGDVIPFPVARQYAHPPQPRSPYDDDALDPYPDAGLGPEGAPGHDRDADRDGELPGHARESEPEPDRGAPLPAPGPDGTGGPGAYTDDPAHSGRDDDAGPAAGGGRQAATRSHEDNGQARAGSSGRGGQSGAGPRPSLPAKSRWSRSPTIPRLVPPQRFPGRDPGTGTPPPDPPA